MRFESLRLGLDGGLGAPQFGDDRRCQPLAVPRRAQGRTLEAGGGAAIPQARKGVPLGDQRHKIPGISDQRAVCRFEVGAVALFRFRHGVIGSGRDGVRQAESVKTRPTHFRRHIAKRS